MHDDHDHGHAHPAPPDHDGSLSDFQLMEIAVRELLVDKGILTADEIRREVEKMDARSPAQGARVVARAWVDPEYKARLLADAGSAITELGYATQGREHLVVVENTPERHNLVVCTLCSCYPWPVLGLPPVWYKSAPYRSRAVIDPRGILREFGLEISEEVEIQVWDSTSEMRYLVLPERPEGTENMTEDELAALVTRDAMIGTAKVTLPGAAQ
jgi:nitrile hydratase alpha subunit